MKTLRTGLALAGLWFGLLAAPALAAEPGARVELPIKQVMLADGTPRYTIPITVAGKTIEAMVDSGSTGLRVLPGTLPEGAFTPTAKGDTYSYGSGAEYKGVIATAPMEIGGLASEAPVPFQAIQTVGCMAAKPKCPVSEVKLADYGIGGDGIPRAGFKAIIGVNMADAPAVNPFYGVGVKSWIIILPRPKESAPGKLILNPTAEDTAGYTKFPIQARFSGQTGGLHDAIWGCLTNGRSKLQLCGPFLLDSGGNGVTINVGQGKPDAPWGPGVDVTMTLGSEKAQPMTAKFVTGQGAPARLNFPPSQGQPNSRIQAGPLPYFGFQALYDPSAHVVGLKPR